MPGHPRRLIGGATLGRNVWTLRQPPLWLQLAIEAGVGDGDAVGWCRMEMEMEMVEVIFLKSVIMQCRQHESTGIKSARVLHRDHRVSYQTAAIESWGLAQREKAV